MAGLSKYFCKQLFKIFYNSPHFVPIKKIGQRRYTGVVPAGLVRQIRFCTICLAVVTPGRPSKTIRRTFDFDLERVLEKHKHLDAFQFKITTVKMYHCLNLRKNFDGES